MFNKLRSHPLRRVLVPIALVLTAAALLLPASSSADHLPAPDTIIDTGPTAGSTIEDQVPEFTFHSSLEPSTFQCRFDAAAFAACDSGSYSPPAPLAEGPHTFEVKAVNSEGLADPTPATRQFSVDLPGSGLFGAPTSYGPGGSGSKPRDVALSDVNADGDLDIAVASSTDGGPDRMGNVGVLLGTGGGTFAAAVNYQTGGDSSGVAIRDLNGDQEPDLAVSNATTASTSGSVSVLLGNGDGTFASAVNYPVGRAPGSVAISDLDGDGSPDLATANGGDTDTVSVLLGTGDGTFATSVNYPTGGEPFNSGGGTEITVRDLDDDGSPDIARPMLETADGVAVLLGDGDGTFASAVNYATGLEAAWGIGSAELTGDAAPDLVTNGADSEGSGHLALLPGDGDGSFGQPTPIKAGGYPANGGPRIADLNGDLKRDLAVPVEFNVSILAGKGNGSFRRPEKYGASTSGGGPVSVEVGDLNRDRKPDLVTANAVSNDLSVLLNTQPPPRCADPPTKTGGSGADVLRGTAGRDVILGRGGNDTIRGLGGDDALCGGDGRDSLAGGAGTNDLCSGGRGSDTATGCERVSRVP